MPVLSRLLPRFPVLVINSGGCKCPALELLRGQWEGDTASCEALDKVFTESDVIPSRVGRSRLL